MNRLLTGFTFFHQPLQEWCREMKEETLITLCIILDVVS